MTDKRNDLKHLEGDENSPLHFAFPTGSVLEALEPGVKGQWGVFRL